MSTSKRWLAALIGLHLALGLLYDWATPIFEAPDEGYHMAVIRHIARTGQLPVQTVGAEADWAQEGSQPPLYHALAAGLTFWVDTSDWAQAYVRNPFLHHIPATTHNVNLFRHLPQEQFPYRGTTLAVHIARWLSLALSAATVYLTYRLAQAVCPARESLALLSAALVALNPKALFINAAANNDNLLMLLSTAALLLCVPFMRPGVERYVRRAAGLGSVLGLAALAKVSGLVLWPVAALAIGWGAWRARDWRRLAVAGAVTAAAAVAVSGWWFWRNYALYGEWLGLNTMVAIAGPRVPAITLFELVREEWYGFFLSYWSVFGVFTILPAEWMHYPFYALTLWALAGGAAAVYRRRGRLRPELILFAVFAGLTLVGVARWTLATPASQGRLLFGAIAALSILMAAGLLAGLSARWSAWVSLGVAVIMAAVAAVIPVAYIAPRYAPPPALPEGGLPPGLRVVRVKFGDSMELIGYTADDALRVPGGGLQVTLYWRALKPMSADYVLALHLLGRDSEEVGKLDTWPGGGTAPTSRWQPGMTFADPYVIPIDDQAQAPTQLRLAVAVWLDDPAEKLLAVTPAGEEIGAAYLIPVGRVVPRQPPAVAPAVADGSVFEYGIRLLGVTVAADGAFTLYWQTDLPVPGDYTVFAHLVDANGEFVTQADAPPLNGEWPTSAWVPGQPFADPRQFDLPAGLRRGRYGLELGFYDPVSGARLAAFKPDGTRWADDIVVIKNVFEIE